MKKLAVMVFVVMLTLPFGVGAEELSVVNAVSQGSVSMPKKVERNSCKRAAKALQNLNLTPNQKELIKSELIEYRAGLIELEPAGKESLKALFTSMYKISPTFNEEEIRENYQPVAAVGEERVILKASMMHDISQELSPTQYYNLVKAQANLFLCGTAPLRFLRRYVFWKALN